MRSIITAPAETLGSVTQIALTGAIGVEIVVFVIPQLAALNARKAAGDTVSPGTGLVRARGVFGELGCCKGKIDLSGCRHVTGLCWDVV